MGGSELSVLWEKLCNILLLLSSLRVSHLGHMGFDYIASSPVLMHPLVVTSLFPVVEDLFWKFAVCFINCSADSCDFGVLTRGSELRDFLR